MVPSPVPVPGGTIPPRAPSAAFAGSGHGNGTGHGPGVEYPFDPEMTPVADSPGLPRRPSPPQRRWTPRVSASAQPQRPGNHGCACP